MNLSKDVRILLERALRFARKNRYIYLTPEMLLLILLEEESFREAVDLCGGDIDALIKDLKGYLEEYVDRGNGKNPEISENRKIGYLMRVGSKMSILNLNAKVPIFI